MKSWAVSDSSRAQESRRKRTRVAECTQEFQAKREQEIEISATVVPV